MKEKKTIEMEHQYTAPSCKVIKTSVNRAIMVTSSTGSLDMEEGETLDW